MSSMSKSDRSRSVTPIRRHSSHKTSVARRALKMGLTVEGRIKSEKRKSKSLEVPLPEIQLASMSSTSKMDRSGSVTPIRRHSSHKTSVARRAIKMGLTVEGRIKSEKRRSKSLEVPPPEIQALNVNQTPGETRDSITLKKSSGGSVCLHEPSSLSADVLERVEAMGVSDEEAEELALSAPRHIKRCMDGIQEDQEYLCPKPLSPTTFAEDLRNASGDVSTPCKAQSDFRVATVDADARASTSGLKAETLNEVGRCEDHGSDFDSDFDDEFDSLNAKNTALVGRGQDIPDDEELEEPVREAIHAVERAMDDEADRLLGVSATFNWSKGFESFKGVPEVFSGPSPGPLKDYDTPYDAFTDIWNRDMMEYIANETNRYAKQSINALKAKGTLAPSSRLHQWYETDADEIAVLFAVYMYMGIDPRTSQYEFWKSNDYLELHRFKQLMTYNRYVLLNKFIHFVDNSNLSQTLSQSEGFVAQRLTKLRPVILHLSSKFSSLYNLSRDVSIDESLTLYKGRLSFVQSIRSKSARLGVKSYELCESRTGYLYKFKIYTGKDADNGPAVVAANSEIGGKTTQVVLDLLKGLEHRGHCVTMDNFYNCPSLARYLKWQGFDCLGVLRVNRKHVPTDINRIPKNVERGTIIARQCGDVSIIAWKDIKLVPMISTYHDDRTFIGSKAGRTVVRPVCVGDYNKTMGGVDLKDQKLSMYLLERKRGMKWYVKMFKRLLNVSIHNAFVMYVSSLKRRNMVSITHREFRYKLAKSLVDEHRRAKTVTSERVPELMRLRRDVLHEPNYTSGRSNRKRCVVCYRQNINKMVHTQCMTCSEFLCFGTCWREWHSLQKLKGQEFRGRKRTHNE